MADQDLWRKNIPEDFEGRFGESWDEEVDAGIVLKSAVAIAAVVGVSFVICWLFIEGFDAVRPPADLSPIAEARERRLPPTPRLQAKPEEEMELYLEKRALRLGEVDPDEWQHAENAGFGWVDELDERVHIPVDLAIDLVLNQAGGLSAVEPATDSPVDVQDLGVDDETPDAAGASQG